MENRAHALAAGLFTLILGGVLLAALWWFSDGREEQRSYLLETTGNVTGLNIEAQVRYRGLSAGKVSDIRIDPQDPRKILVEIRMRSDIPITRGTRASLAYQGVTGLAYVELRDRGDDPTPVDAGPGELPRLALSPGLMDQLSDTTIDTLQRVKLVADRITEFFSDENVGRLSSSLKRLESATSGIDRTFAEAPATLAAIREVLNHENMARLSSTLANLERASADASPAMAELRSLMTRLQTMAERLDNATAAAENSVLDNTLPELNHLLKDLTVTSQRLGRLIEEVDAAPQMLLLGRGERAPGPGEEGFAAPAAPARTKPSENPR